MLYQPPSESVGKADFCCCLDQLVVVSTGFQLRPWSGSSTLIDTPPPPLCDSCCRMKMEMRIATIRSLFPYFDAIHLDNCSACYWREAEWKAINGRSVVVDVCSRYFLCKWVAGWGGGGAEVRTSLHGKKVITRRFTDHWLGQRVPNVVWCLNCC